MSQVLITATCSTRGRGPKAATWNQRNTQLAKAQKKKIRALDSHIAKLKSAMAGRDVQLTDSEDSTDSDSDQSTEAPPPPTSKKPRKEKTYSQNPAVSPELQHSSDAQLPPAPFPVLLPTQFEVRLNYALL